MRYLAYKVVSEPEQLADLPVHDPSYLERSHTLKSVLPEWYRPSDQEISEFVRNGTVALDTNVLLSLYRVNSTQRSQIIDVLNKVGDRLWVPYQVAYEYQKNRLTVASESQQVYDKVEAIPTENLTEAFAVASESLRNACADISTGIRDKEIKDSVSKVIEGTIEKLDRFKSECQKEMLEVLAKIRSENAIAFVKAKGDDPVRLALDELLKPDNIGSRPEADALIELRKEAAKRIEARTPPGYKDDRKEDPLGDALIWLELLEYAKSSKKMMLFITNDVKDDFYLRVHGHTIGPRAEMVREMLDKAGQPYHQTTLDGFLRLASAHLEVTVTEDTITTVESSRKRRQEASIDIVWPPSGAPVIAGSVINEITTSADRANNDALERRNRHRALERIEEGKDHVESLTERYGPLNPKVLSAMRFLARDYRTVGELDIAQALSEEVLTRYSKVLEQEDPRILQARTDLAAVFLEQGHRPDADRQVQIVEEHLNLHYADNPIALSLLDRLRMYHQSRGISGKRAALIIVSGDFRELKLAD
ncbi:PIN-like domain-containing protein [Nocardia rhamnosiphila]|uniref:PIN domain-containing protein n=1 Tax=Nocardia rhamnosiphila TaxID=426716 RepID=A0ABV2WT06_9NOCA